MFSIIKFDFDNNTPIEVKSLQYKEQEIGLNWPIVYIINNEEEVYVGETVNASRRIEQHLQNSERQKLTEIRIISDETFNKSVILDLESYLIQYMASDGKYAMQNRNNGMRNHNYYERKNYEQVFKKIWDRLRGLGIVNNSIEAIENSEMYKYSPYKSLGLDQMDVEREIVRVLAEYKNRQNGATILVQGSAGTGKTILAIYLLKLFADINTIYSSKRLILQDYFDEDAETVMVSESIEGIRKIGLVIPQKSLRSSLKDVFSKIKRLNSEMVMSPEEVVREYLRSGEKFDLLIVDEAHRLKCRNKGNIFNHRGFIKCNKALGLDKKEGTELDWLLKCSNNQIMFRDPLQTVRHCDIDTEDFMATLSTKYGKAVVETTLNNQWRCKGGKEYVDYIKKLLWSQPTQPLTFGNYEVKIYRNCEQMVEDIKEKNRQLQLCRTVAGYAWPWNRKRVDDYTILIQGQKYRWNRTYDNWISSKTSVDEIGSIHTIQGYDLNYAGVIIGEDIKYDKKTERIIACKENYYDSLGKAGLVNDPEMLRGYLLNIYLTLLTRGIYGTYIYICDDDLREYMSDFFEVV